MPRPPAFDMRASGYDYIVVGAGSAGSLLANRLSANPCHRVLLLEAGGWDEGFWMRLPVGYYRNLTDKRFVRDFATDPGWGTAGRTINWPRGRVMGGSSSVNGLVFIRGQAEDFDDWVQLGAVGWGSHDVLPFFKKLERYDGPADDFRGKTGDLTVSSLRSLHPWCEAWLVAAERYGLPCNPDFNGATTYGVGRYQLSVGARWRASGSRAFIHPALRRPNLTIVTGALVSRVLVRSRRAIGVEWVRGGVTQSAHCDGEVVLCAGAVQSPQILQLSGIGPAQVLRSQRVSVAIDAQEVGANLQDHFQVRTVLKCREKRSLNNLPRQPIGMVRAALQWAFTGTGPLMAAAGQVGGAVCSKYAINGRPDIQIAALPASLDRPGQPMHKFPGFTAVAWQCHPVSRGTICIESADPTRSPRISPNYLADDMDRKLVVASLEVLREIHHQSVFRGLWEEEVTPGLGHATSAQLLDYARLTGGTVFHPVGTCRMGSDDTAVVDSDLRVNGIERLRVADASVMPKITSANTNAPCYMIAEVAADRILRRPATQG